MKSLLSPDAGSRDRSSRSRRSRILHSKSLMRRTLIEALRKDVNFESCVRESHALRKTSETCHPWATILFEKTSV